MGDLWLCIHCGADVGGRDGVCPNCGPLTERQRMAEIERLRTERDELRAEVDRLQRSAKWLPDDPRDLDVGALRGIKLRWATGPEEYQADADALIGALMAARAEVDRLTEKCYRLHAEREHYREHGPEADDLRSTLHATADALLSLVDEDGDHGCLSENVGGIVGPHHRTTRYVHHPEGCSGDGCARDCGGVYITTELDGDVLQVVEVRLAE